MAFYKNNFVKFCIPFKYLFHIYLEDRIRASLILGWHSDKTICLPMQETQETWVQSLGPEDPLGEEMETHTCTLAWKFPWTERLMGYSPCGHKELGMTKPNTELGCHLSQRWQPQFWLSLTGWAILGSLFLRQGFGSESTFNDSLGWVLYPTIQSPSCQVRLLSLGRNLWKSKINIALFIPSQVIQRVFLFFFFFRAGFFLIF